MRRNFAEASRRASVLFLIVTQWSRDDFERKLLPESTTLTLVRASALISGWELIKTSVYDDVRGFFLEGFDESGFLYGDEYKTHVLSLAKHPFDASVRWLVKMDALTEAQAEVLHELRQHRNEVAHELVRYVVDPGVEVRVDMLLAGRDCLKALARFFGAITAETDPEFDRVDVDYDRIESGSSLVYDHLLALAGVDLP